MSGPVEPSDAGFTSRAKYAVSISDSSCINIGDHYHLREPTASRAFQELFTMGRPPAPVDALQPRNGLWRSLMDGLSAGNSGTSTVILAGDGGCGKTQLAARYFHSVAGVDEGLAIALWIQATSRESIIGSYAAAARLLGTEQPGDLSEQANGFLQLLASLPRRWLVVLDDLPDMAAMADLVPGGHRGQVIITTRHRNAIVTKSAGQSIIEVPVYSSQEADRYLRARLGEQALPATALGEADELAEDLGFLPLALGLAAAYVLDQGLTCSDMRRRLKDQTRKLQELLPDLTGTGSGLLATWSLALQRADERSAPGAASRLALALAVLDPHGAPESIVSAAALRDFLVRPAGDSAQPDSGLRPGTSGLDQNPIPHEALRSLHGLSVVAHEPQDGAGRILMHMLAQRAIREMSDPEDFAGACDATASALLECWPASPSRATAEMMHANCAILFAQALDRLVATAIHPLVFRYASGLDSAGQYVELEEFLGKVVFLATRRGDGNRPDLLTARRLLADSSGKLGDAAGAAASLAELLAEVRQGSMPGRPHRGTSPPADEPLGPGLAPRRWNRALRSTAQAGHELGTPETDTSDSQVPDPDQEFEIRYTLAHWRGVSGDDAGSVRDYTKLVGDLTLAKGADDRDTLRARLSLALVNSEEHLPQAIQDLEVIRADSARKLGTDDELTLTAWRWLLSCKVEDGSAAATETEELLTNHLRVLGPDHPDSLATRALISLQADGRGDPAALAMILDSHVRALGRDHPQTLEIREALAFRRKDDGDPAGATNDLQAVLSDQARVLGRSHPNVFATRRTLAEWQAESDRQGAIRELNDLLADQLAVPRHSLYSIVATRESLGYQYHQGDQHELACTMFEAALSDWTQSRGAQNPDLFPAHLNFAASMSQNRSVIAAISHMRRAMADLDEGRKYDGLPAAAKLTGRCAVARWQDELGDSSQASEELRSIIPELRQADPADPADPGIEEALHALEKSEYRRWGLLTERDFKLDPQDLTCGIEKFRLDPHEPQNPRISVEREQQDGLRPVIILKSEFRLLTSLWDSITRKTPLERNLSMAKSAYQHYLYRSNNDLLNSLCYGFRQLARAAEVREPEVFRESVRGLSHVLQLRFRAFGDEEDLDEATACFEILASANELSQDERGKKYAAASRLRYIRFLRHGTAVDLASSLEAARSAASALPPADARQPALARDIRELSLEAAAW
jgi:hypothetical protein